MRTKAPFLLIIIFSIVSGIAAETSSGKPVSPFKKNALLLIGVPVNASTAQKEKSEWFSGFAEQYLYFRLGVSSTITIIPSEKIHTAVVATNNPYDVSVVSYDQLAQNLGVTFILHHSYELSRDEKSAHYYAQIISTRGVKTFSSFDKEFPLQAFTMAMDEAAYWIFSTIIPSFDSTQYSRFFNITATSSDIKEMKTIGRIICRKYASTPQEIQTSTQALLALADKDSRNVFAHFLAIKLYEYSRLYDKANQQLKNILMILPYYASFYTDVCRNYRIVGKYEEALSYASQAQKQNIVSFPLLIEGAQSLEAMGRDEKAVKAYSAILGADSSESTALLFFARQNNKIKNSKKAIEYCNKIIAIHPRNGEARIEKAKSLITLKQYDEAENLLSESSSLLPNATEPTRLIGDIYSLKNDYAKASLFYDAAWKSSSSDFNLLLQSVRTWEKVQNHQRALANLQKAENIFPDSMLVQKMLGHFYYLTGDTVNTLFHLERFLAKRVEDADVFITLGDIYTHKGSFDKAFSMYNRAMPLVTDKTKVTFALALLYFKKGDTGAAITYFKEIIKKQPENARAYTCLADAWFKEQNYTIALKEYKKNRYFEKENSAIQRQIALCYLNLKEYNAAAREFMTYIDMNSGDAEAHYYLSVVYLYLNKVNKSEETLARAGSLGKPGCEMLYLLGQGHAFVSNPQKSIGYYLQCIALNPKHENALLKLAETYLQEKQPLPAAEAYLQLYNIDNSKYSGLLGKAGLLYEESNDTVKAVEQYKNFVQNNYDNPVVYIRLSRIEYRKKSYPSVVTLLEKIPAAEITDKSDIMSFADSYCSIGKYTQAIDWLLKIVSKDAKNRDAQILLGNAYENSNDIANALKTYKTVVQITEGEVKATYSHKIGLLHEKDGKTPDAIETYIKNITEFPADFRNFRQLITIYTKAENWGAARAALEKCVAIPDAKPFYWKELAQVCLKQNDKAGAVKNYATYTDMNPGDDEAWYQLGELYFVRGLFPKALSFYEKALALRPNSFPVIYKCALAYHNSGNTQKSVEFFQKAAALDSTNIEVLTYLTTCYRTQNDAGKLLETLKKLTVLQPDNYEIKVELGYALLEQNKTDEAIEVLEHACRINPKDPDIHILLSGIYIKTGNENARFSHIKKALTENPDNPDVLCLMGEFYFEQKQDKIALGYIEKALKINPEHADAICNYSRYLFNQGDIKKSLTYIKQALQSDAYNPRYLALYARINRKLNNTNIALKTIENALTLDSNNTEILSCAGTLFKEDGRVDEGTRLLLKALSLTDKCFECHNTLGEIYYEEMQCAKAAGYFRRALEINGYDEEIMMKYGRTLVLSYQNEQAKAIFERIVSTNPKNQEALYRLAHIYLLSDNIEKVTSFSKLHKNGNKTMWDHLIEGELHEKQGNLDAALISYNVVLRLQQEMPDAFAGLGRLEFIKGNFNDAIINFSKALVKDPYNPYLLLNLGQAYEGIDQTSSALDTYTDIVNKFPQIPEAYLLSATIYSRENNHKQAAEILMIGNANIPENPQLYSALATEYKNRGEYENAIEAYKNAANYGGDTHINAYLEIANIYFNDLKNEKEAKQYLKKYLKAGGNKELLEKYNLASIQI